MARNLLACQFIFIVSIVYVGANFARQKHPNPNRPLHKCDVTDESSEECNEYDYSRQMQQFGHEPLMAKPEFAAKFTIYNHRGEHKTFKREEFDKSLAEKMITDGAQWKVLIHGFLNDRDSMFPQNVKNAYLKEMKENNVRYNILVFDWGEGACAHIGFGAAYAEAVKNVRTAADKLAEMLVHLKSRNFVNGTSLHLIGHSLGAHVAGITSYKVEHKFGGDRIWRISALDPAGPLFWKTVFSNVIWDFGPVDYRKLNATQATFVDVYHTSKAFGAPEELGDVDIYVNGGKDQPSCNIEFKILGFTIKLWVFRSLLQVCSHNYATDLFAKSINDQSMMACFGCKSQFWYDWGMCRCDAEMVLGEHLVENSESPEPNGTAYATVAKDTSVGSNYMQIWKNNTSLEFINKAWNALCPIF